MSRSRPESDCLDLAFQAGYALQDPAEVALEDYARVLTRSRAAEAIRAGESGPVTGVHVCGTASGPKPGAREDIEGFARDMALHGAGGGLGWS
jgi:hypothetical protein